MFIVASVLIGVHSARVMQLSDSINQPMSDSMHYPMSVVMACYETTVWCQYLRHVLCLRNNSRLHNK